VRSASLDSEALPLTEFTHKYQAQVALLGIQFMWTLDCEDSLYRAKTEKGAQHAYLALALALALALTLTLTLTLALALTPSTPNQASWV
tara:strand:+ start:80 stop:346 length:267 start_codon:yes stop_codon:yes gene_type:complete